VLLFALGGLSAAQKKVNLKGAKAHDGDDRMSPMGHLAAQVNAALAARGFVTPGVTGGNDFDKVGCDNPADCGDDDVPVAGGQAETTIAVDSTGQHVVIGFNDTQGFALNPTTLSGFMYSDDGGKTFVVGGQLPTPGNVTIGTTKYPQVFGDPEVKYLGACNFVYSSIAVFAKQLSPTTPLRTVQSMSVHRSTDCGHTWTGPFEVTGATNPNGALTAGGTPRDAADKEFMDVDAATGRVILSWSNFTPFAPGGVEIRTTYSDNILTGNPPTWTTGQIVSAIAEDGQSSIPRFAGNGTNAYVAWRRFPDFYFQSIAFARSLDNGATWQTPLELGDGPFFASDYQIGNDRPNDSPAMAVDQHRGTVYVVYANNNSQDGSDIYFTRSTDKGQTFSTPLILNSRPGQDRSQWYPWVTVDKSTGRVWVFYYDQGVAASGDLTQVTYTYSDDAGKSWKQPLQLSERTFRAGWGNDTGQPNLGDYNQAVAQGGELFASFAFTFRPVGGFVDGEPTSTSFTVPDTTFARLPEADHKFKPTTLDLMNVAVTDSGGNGSIDPNETIGVTATFRNYVTNPLNADKVRGATATLTTTTDNVSVVQGFSPIHNLDPGQSGTNDSPFVIQTAPGFVPGTPIELAFTIRSAEHGNDVLKYTQLTGTPVPSVLLSENFDEVAPGALPAGWSAAHGAGQNTVPWTTRNNFCGSTSNAAFHINANDGAPGKSPSRFERLFSPLFTVPADATWVSVDFDICTDTEDDPNYNILAYDGFFLRVTDQTTGHILRSNLLEAFADEFTTGAIQSMPRHMPRNSDPNYFANGDMAMWAGFSNGPQHVHLRLPGMAGTTAQLRFEFAQDGGGICTDVRPTSTDCGVSVDNIVVKSVVAPSTQP
jgi:hypothetical protein